MSDRQSNLESVQNLYAAFGRGDLAYILNSCSESVDWGFIGPDTVPYSGRYSGRGGVEQFFSRLAQSCDIRKFEPRDFIADESSVVVTGLEEAVARPTGRAYQTPWVHVWRIQDGQVVHFREFSDSYAVAVAFQGIPSPDGVVH